MLKVCSFPPGANVIKRICKTSWYQWQNSEVLLNTAQTTESKEDSTVIGKEKFLFMLKKSTIFTNIYSAALYNLIRCDKIVFLSTWGQSYKTYLQNIMTSMIEQRGFAKYSSDYSQGQRKMSFYAEKVNNICKYL